jgi:hypothetical protein
MADLPGGVPVLHSEILRKWITSSATVTDQSYHPAGFSSAGVKHAAQVRAKKRSTFDSLTMRVGLSQSSPGSLISIAS